MFFFSLGNQADLSLHPKKSKRWVTTEERNFLRQKFQSSRIEVAKNIWNASLHLKGSLGEKYLVDHRKIPSIFIERLQFRFLPKGSAYLDYRVSQHLHSCDFQNLNVKFLNHLYNMIKPSTGSYLGTNDFKN